MAPLFVEDGQTDEIGEKAYTKIKVSEGKEDYYGSVDYVDNNGNKKSEEGLLLREDEQIEITYDIKEKLTAPVSKDTVIGKIQYWVGGTVYRTKLVVTEDTIERIDFNWCMQKVLWNFGL